MIKKILIFTLAAMTVICLNTCKTSADYASSIETEDCYSSETSRTGGEMLVITDGVPAFFSDITGKEWKLTDIHLADGNINFNRYTLTQEGAGDIFTLIFDDKMASGKGEPNLYSSPYTLGDKQAISIMPMRSTLMASIFPNEKLNEYDFFNYLINVYEWGLVDKKLELFSKTKNGGDVRLVWVESE